MQQEEIISKVRETIEQDPNRGYIRKVYLFGSFLRGDDRQDSDVDLLYETKGIMSLFQIAATRHRLEQKLEKKVDFVDRDSVIPELRDEIFHSAKKIYERA